jgi:hypothetical protein
LAHFLFMAHSGVRYLVLLAGAFTLLLALVGLSTGATSGAGRAARRLFRLFAGVLDLQVVLGLAAVLTRPFQGIFIGHLITMVLAAVAAHVVAARLRKLPPEKSSTPLVLTGTLVTLVLLVAGIMALGRPILGRRGGV